MAASGCKGCSPLMCCAPSEEHAGPCPKWLEAWLKDPERACLMCKSYFDCKPFGETGVEHAEMISGTLTPHICSVCKKVILGSCWRYEDGGVTKYLCLSCKTPRIA